jgi:Protein of unknown function (DUF1194)
VVVLIGALLVMMPQSEAQPDVRVNVELLLALDTSASVSRQEFELQLKGIAQAFRDPDVLAAVDNLRPLGVAIGVMQWGGVGDSRLIIPFTHVETARDAKAFGFLVGRTYRFTGASSTAIVTAIEDGVALVERNGFDGERRVIDVSGDGKDNSGLSLEDARELANETGVVINGLAIEADEAGLSQYYRDHVITGPDSFVETARGFDDFARAITAKLVRELRPLGS